jgi:hypothetical protein
MLSIAGVALVVAAVAKRLWQFNLRIDHAGGGGIVRRRPMINKSKLGAIAFIAAMGIAAGFASPAFAAHYGPAYTSPGQTGGGSAGYNSRLSNDYRLKQHSQNRNNNAAHQQ